MQLLPFRTINASKLTDRGGHGSSGENGENVEQLHFDSVDEMTRFSSFAWEVEY